MNSYPKKLYLPVFGGKFIPDGRDVVVRNQVEEIVMRDKGFTDLEDAEHKSNTRGFLWFLWMDIKINWDWWFVIIVMVMMMVFSFIVAEAHLLR